MASILPHTRMCSGLQVGATVYRIVGAGPLNHAPLHWSLAWLVQFLGSLVPPLLKAGHACLGLLWA